MTPLTRKRALQLGATRYFTGLPCRRGHIAQRSVASRQCLVCAELNHSYFRQRNRDEINRRQNERYALKHGAGWRGNALAQWGVGA